jgi:hypothetical protein
MFDAARFRSASFRLRPFDGFDKLTASKLTATTDKAEGRLALPFAAVTFAP